MARLLLGDLSFLPLCDFKELHVAKRAHLTTSAMRVTTTLEPHRTNVGTVTNLPTLRAFKHSDAIAGRTSWLLRLTTSQPSKRNDWKGDAVGEASGFCDGDFRWLRYVPAAGNQPTHPH
jgi:hypothetical protein